MKIQRCPANPIITPGRFPWRQTAVFNPGAILENGKFYLYERAAGSLRPFQTSIGLLESNDGIHFSHVVPHPILTGEMVSYPDGSVQDARVVKIDNRYYLTYALQPYRFDCWPTGVGPPLYYTDRYPEWQTLTHPMVTRSGIAVSDDLIHFKPLGFTTPPEIDDRDNALFPEKINGRFALLRRPMSYVGDGYGTPKPGMWISYSADLYSWSELRLIAKPESAWEGGKIGAAGPPIRTKQGWLLLYHGVDESAVYRVGAMLLDLENVERVVARTKNFIMEPEEYYEKFGLVIPNVIFPTGNVVKDGLLYIYYGCADTAIGLATVPLEELLEFILRGGESSD